MKAGIYCRVSTDDQEREGTSLQTQMEHCSNYCLDKDYQIVQRFSEAYSGLTLDRPKLKQLTELARNGSIDVIVIYCLDRISRDPTHGVILTQELESLNVSLEAVTENVESSDLGKLINYIKGFASKLEAEKIKERTLRGKAAHARNRKLPIGTGIGLYGYEWNKTNKKREIIDHEAETVRNIFNLAIQGTSTNKIATTLNEKGIKTKSGSVWHPLTVKRILNNTTYTGKTYYGQTKRIDGKTVQQPEEEWILLDDVTPPIITDEIFNLAQETIKITKQSRPIKQNAHYLLTGFIRCPKCGSPIGGTMLSGKYRYYQCRGAKPTATRGKICDAGYIRANELEYEVWRQLTVMLSSPTSILKSLTAEKQDNSNEVITLIDKQIKELRKKIKSYKSKEKNLYDLLINESVTKDYVLEAIEKLKKDKEGDETQLKALNNEKNRASKTHDLSLQLSEISLNEFTKFDAYDYGDVEAVELPDGSWELEKVDNQERLMQRRLLLDSINLKVLATPDNFSFEFSLRGDLVSSKQYDEFADFDRKLASFEHEHEYLPTSELLEKQDQLKEFTLSKDQSVNINDDLVTTERTSA